MSDSLISDDIEQEKNVKTNNKMNSEVKKILSLTLMATMVYWQLAPVFPAFLQDK